MTKYKHEALRLLLTGVAFPEYTSFRLKDNSLISRIKAFFDR